MEDDGDEDESVFCGVGVLVVAVIVVMVGVGSIVISFFSDFFLFWFCQFFMIHKQMIQR